MSEPMAQADYDGSKCPNCQGDNVSGGDIDPADFNAAYRNCWCDDCEAQWTEVLKVTGYGNLEIPSKITEN